MNENVCNVEVFARVTGFFRPVQSWNKGKAEEFKDRRKYNIETETTGPRHENSRTAEAFAR